MNYQNMLERLSFFGGVKGNAGATFGYKAKVMYKSIEGLPLFVNNVSTPYQFDVVYDGNANDKVSYFGIEGEMNLRLSQLVNVGGRLNIDNYTTAGQDEAWFTPKLRFAANARFNISEKLYIDAEGLFHGLSYAKTFNYNLALYDPAAANSTAIVPGSYAKVTIPEFFDLSAGAEYKATSKLGVFVKANNIFNKEYVKIYDLKSSLNETIINYFGTKLYVPEKYKRLGYLIQSTSGDLLKKIHITYYKNNPKFIIVWSLFDEMFIKGDINEYKEFMKNYFSNINYHYKKY
jgi:hypothetical protein